MNSLLGESPKLVEFGTALMANLATKEVKAVVCILHLLIAFSLRFFSLDISFKFPLKLFYSNLLQHTFFHTVKVMFFAVIYKHFHALIPLLESFL